MAFQGWRIVLVAVVAHALGAGLFGIYAFAATPILREFGASDAVIGLGISIMVLGMTLASPVIGPAVDRGPIRAIMLCGVAVMLVSFWGLSRSTALWQLGAGLALGSVGIAMYGHLPVSVLIVNWFVARRGLALAAGAAGMSVGQFLVPPLSAWLVGVYGWRDAVAMLATGAAALTLPVFALFVVKRPEDVGLVPDGSALSSRGQAAGPSPARSAREVLADRNFWLIGLGISLAFCVPVSFVFLVRRMEALGIAPQSISWLIASMAIVSLMAKFAAGWLSDRSDERLVAVGVLLVHAAGWVLLALGSSFPAMLLGCATIALGSGALMPLPPMLVGACFGRGLVGRVAGLHAPLGLPFLISAAPLVGILRDRSGDYVAPFLALAAVLALAALILSFVRIPRATDGEVVRRLGEAPGASQGYPRDRARRQGGLV